MDLSIYRVIIGPVVSDKAYKLNRTSRQLMIKVHQDASKPQIRDALKLLFGVESQKIRTCVRRYPQGRSVASKGRRGGAPSLCRMKVAYVTLAEGHSLELFDQPGVGSHEASVSGGK